MRARERRTQFLRVIGRIGHQLGNAAVRPQFHILSTLLDRALSEEEIRATIDVDHALRYVDVLFERVFGDS